MMMQYCVAVTRDKTTATTTAAIFLVLLEFLSRRNQILILAAHICTLGSPDAVFAHQPQSRKTIRRLVLSIMNILNNVLRRLMSWWRGRWSPQSVGDVIIIIIIVTWMHSQHCSSC